MRLLFRQKMMKILKTLIPKRKEGPWILIFQIYSCWINQLSASLCVNYGSEWFSNEMFYLLTFLSMYIIITKISSLLITSLSMSYCWKKRAALNSGQNPKMDNWKGKYLPAKKSNIWEAFAGACFILVTGWVFVPPNHTVKPEGLCHVVFNMAKWVTVLNTVLCSSV